jgi:hypothetical protein
MRNDSIGRDKSPGENAMHAGFLEGARPGRSSRSRFCSSGWTTFTHATKPLRLVIPTFPEPLGRSARSAWLPANELI